LISQGVPPLGGIKQGRGGDWRHKLFSSKIRAISRKR